ncbi:MAG: RdgB/HAM1 family non-canonical purine pyrophosphatase, dITP/XTP pyrophosphatase [Candidatus Saccharibacteria bacterium]|nr:RdgB/HAM1 family non-canonical purine pyrophosphatase, dITP/XTP pyrophosphatase [Candidatus Saccharibacteria bacterium]
MKHVTYVTTNPIKFMRAERLANELGFSVEQVKIDFEEIQGDGKTIAARKAQQAFDQLQKPVVVTDDEWIIAGLGGFPGAYMKQMNEWFSPGDWLRLTHDLADRSIVLRQHTIYQDADGQQYFVDDNAGLLLTEARGESNYSHLSVTSFDGGAHSLAEDVTAGKPLLNADKKTVWHQLANWFATQES